MAFLTSMLLSKDTQSDVYYSRPLEDGDIINVDVTVFLDGFHGDTSDTWLVGSVVSSRPVEYSTNESLG